MKLAAAGLFAAALILLSRSFGGGSARETRNRSTATQATPVAKVDSGGAQITLPSTVPPVALPNEDASAAPETGLAAASGSAAEAVSFLQQILDFIGNGPAFDAKVRETVWAGGREVVGVGTYVQAGGGSGRYNLQITMHDGDGKHRLQQISDGKLAWTRTEIAGGVSLRRVDVGRLEEYLRGIIPETSLSPRLTVGAWGELLSQIGRDYELRIDTARLKINGDDQVQPMRVLIGDLTPTRRKAVLEESGRSQWPVLYPSRVHVAVKATDDGSGLAVWVPARIEFWSDPLAAAGSRKPKRRLITLIEIYSLRPITPPPAERFRFENQEADVNFVIETERYLESYGVNLTERQRRQLYR